MNEKKTTPSSSGSMIEPVAEGAQVKFVERDTYLFFLLTGKESEGSLVAKPGKVKRNPIWGGTCEALSIKAVGPTLPALFNTLELEAKKKILGRNPHDMTEYLLINGMGLGYPAESHDPKTAALQTILNCDPDIYYRMINVKVKVLVPEKVDPESAKKAP